MNRVRGLISDLNGDMISYLTQIYESEVTMKLGDAVVLARKLDALKRASSSLKNTSTSIYNGTPISYVK